MCRIHNYKTCFNYYNLFQKKHSWWGPQYAERKEGVPLASFWLLAAGFKLKRTRAGITIISL